MLRFALCIFWFVSLAACGSKEVILTPIDSGNVGDTGGDTALDTVQDTVQDTAVDSDTAPIDTGPTEEELDAIWGDARLVITSPSSGDFLPYHQSADFAAEVVDGDGNPMEFSDIKWGSDIDAAWVPVGASFSDATLNVGTHALTATADLPNGDRLAYTIGGVLVQAEDAGIYVGNVTIDVTVEYDGTPYTVSCIGTTTVTVNAEGDEATGDSTCTISLFGYDTDASHLIELEVSDADLSGIVALDLTWFTYDFDAVGTVGDGAMEAAWSDDVYGIATVDGTLSAERVTRDTTSE